MNLPCNLILSPASKVFKEEVFPKKRTLLNNFTTHNLLHSISNKEKSYTKENLCVTFNNLSNNGVFEFHKKRASSLCG